MPDPMEVPHIESLCAPKRREKFLGISPAVDLDVPRLTSSNEIRPAEDWTSTNSRNTRPNF